MFSTTLNQKKKLKCFLKNTFYFLFKSNTCAHVTEKTYYYIIGIYNFYVHQTVFLVTRIFETLQYINSYNSLKKKRMILMIILEDFLISFIIDFNRL